MLESLRPVFVITRREVRDQFRDWRVIFPVVGLTIFFPFLMNFTAQQILGFVQKYGATILGERLIPFLLLIVGFFPISVSLVIALESFVGEKERGSIEPLLNTPLKDWQIYLGKLLSAIVPPLLSSYLGMSVYITGLTYNKIPIPTPDLLILIIMLTTVQAIMMVAGAVVVSSQATSVRAANLLASFIIIPVALLIQGESIVMFWGDYQTLWWAVFGLGVLTILLVRVGLAHFQREELLGKEIDVLNLKWAWARFRQAFSGGAHSVWDWYSHVLPATIRQMGLPILIVSILGLSGFLLGMMEVAQFKIPLDKTSLQNMDGQIQNMLKLWPIGNFGPVFAIWWQNLRVLLLAFILGLFSLGILGSLPLMASMGVVGYLYALLNFNGIPASTYILFVLPHGILEIPAAILVTAAIIKAGAILATPTPGKTVGEVWIITIADWAKIMFGLTVPLLFIAACIEAWLTPRLALFFMH